MRVAIALVSSSGQMSGVQRHAINVARCLLSRSEIAAVHLIAAPWQQGFLHDSAPRGDARLHLHIAPIRNDAVSRNLWYFARLPEFAAKLQADIVHLAYPMPLCRGAFRCPVVVTLHDLYPYDIPENFGLPKVAFNRLVLRQCLREVHAIACVSKCTLSRLQSRFAHAHAFVVPNCVEPYPHVSAHTPLPRWSGQPFLLCVAQHRRNKNVLFLLRVFERLVQAGELAPETRLVIVGIPGPETKAILRFMAAAEIGHRVFLLNGISESELQWCYRNCDLLLAPSITEGFGLPVAEGLLAGCRIVCSDIPAFRETGGDQCRYALLDAESEENFAEAVRGALRGPHGQPITLPQFSEAVIASEYVRIYRFLLQRMPSPHRLPTPVCSPERSASA